METCEKCGKKAKHVRKDGSSKCYECGFETSVDDEKYVEMADDDMKTIKKAVSPVGDKDESLGDWELGEVPTNFGVAIVNRKTGETLDVMSALVKLLNDVDYLKKVWK